MRIVVQIVENYLKQEVPSIVITTDKNKYLFNVPSAFQRFTREHGQKFPFGARFFFTKTSVSSITGLTGLLLSMYSQSFSNPVKLYTDEKMFKYMEELRYKMGFKALISSYCSWDGKLRKGIINGQTLEKLMTLQNFSDIFDNMNEFIDAEIPKIQQNNALDFYNKQTKQFKDEDISIIPFFVEQNHQVLTNYIIGTGSLPGRVLPEKLKEYGIKGKDIGIITKNGKIEIGGQTIYLNQCKEEDTPGPNVILLHYTHSETISQIISNKRLAEFLSDNKNYIYSVIHIVQDPQTIYSLQFKQLIAAFPQYTEHIVYNHHFRNSTDKPEDLFRLSYQIKQISALHQYFPLCLPNLKVRHQQYLKKEIEKTQAIDQMFPEFKVKCYKRYHELIVVPKKSWGYKPVVKAQEKDFVHEQTMIPEVKAQLEPIFAEKFKQIDPKIVFLGTGSMKPSKHRNVSSIMIEWLPNFNIMMDCGQGSHIQLIDHYGYELYEQVVLSIRTIFITHIHSDHNLGLLDLISERTKILKKLNLDISSNKLYLILPANVVPWYDSFCQNVQNLNEGCSVIFIQALRNQDYSFGGTMSKQYQFKKSCDSKMESEDEQIEKKENKEEGEDAEEEDQLTFIKPEWNDLLKRYFEQQQNSLNEFMNLLQKNGIKQFFPCPVIHCPQSYGISITHKNGVKVSYSGDTRPCQEFAKSAANSTILIHEATFGDDLARNAQSHFHSTVGEAIDIAMKSNSWKLALTHFSQRYKSAADIVDPSNYNSNPLKKKYSENHTIVCFDHLEIESSKGHILPQYTRALAAAIPKDGNQ